MPLVPRHVKHRREFRDKMRGAAKSGKTIAFGKYDLMVLKSHWIANGQIEAARVTITRYMKYGGKVWIRIFPHKSYTAKDVGIHVGSGKGTPAGWIVVVKRGEIIFKIGDVSEEVTRETLRLASTRLPIKCKFITKSTEVGGEPNED